MEKFWLKQAGRVAAQVNGARWLQVAAPGAAALSFAVGCMLLVTRRAGWSPRPLVFAAVGVFLGIALFALRRMRQSWFSSQDGLVRLDATLHLHNRLTSAAAGVGPWPQPTAIAKSGFRWRWHKLATPVLLGVIFLLTSAWMPIHGEKVKAAVKIEPPLAWTQVEAAIEELKQDQVTESEALENLEQKLDALRSQSEESWYSQSSLEAGAALREETGQAIAALERNLNSAQSALPQPGQQPSGAAPISPEKESQWNEAMKGLQAGSLPLNPADLSALKQCTNGKCSLSPEQIQALKKKLGEQGVSCKSALAKAGDALSNCKLDPLTTPQDQPAPGGGGKTAPLGIREKPTALQPQKEEGLDAKDMENASLGDVIQTSLGQHDVDPTAGEKASAGGAVASVGAGGDAVWKIAPSPKEQTVLKEYFK